MAEVERIGIGVVIRPAFDPVARPFTSLTDAEWDAAWEQPMRATITALQQAFHEGFRRIVVIIPTTAMTGGASYGHTAATAEAVRVLVKSAARQWGSAGVTVNVVAIEPAAVLTSPASAGPVSIAPAAFGAIGGRDPSSVIEFLCSEAASDVTGQTITVDGGVWM